MKPEGGTVHIVGAALGDHAEVTPRFDTVLGSIKSGLDLEFRDRIRVAPHDDSAIGFAHHGAVQGHQVVGPTHPFDDVPHPPP